MSDTDYQNEHSEADVCRVCRSEATSDKPLFYPCVCTGSIKYIHQDCLVQWLKYSKKEICELCNHKFIFAPIYHPDMPKRLPFLEILKGLCKNTLKAIKFWLHIILVVGSWICVVPLTACRIYRCLFTGSVSSLLTLPLDMLSTENLLQDALQGGFIVLCSLCAFIGLVWLREQIMTGGGPAWLEADAQNIADADVLVDDAIVENNMNVDDAHVQPNFDDADNENVQFVEQRDNNNEPADDVQNQNLNVVNQNNAVVAADNNNFNHFEWDRAAEELTWERLLGLDGSLLFLEHVFWVISLNTLFILIFAFCPYHVGHYMIHGFNFETYFEKTNFNGLLTTLTGYVVFAVLLSIAFVVVNMLSLYRARKIIGICYIAIKVLILIVIEICIFPLICGIWIDLCSLKLFNSTIDERITSFQAASGAYVFMRWLVGMVYVFYFATFVFLLREILRPGVLWFMRNLNDPDFNPIQEMIQLPVIRHLKRFITSIILFGFSVVLILFLPIKFMTFISLNVTPYNFTQSSETLASDLSIELLFLHLILPALLEKSHIRIWIKNFVYMWALVVSSMLGLKSFLLGDNKENENPIGNNGAVNHVEQRNNLFQFNVGVAHQALLQNNAPITSQNYTKTSYLKLRIFLLLIVICISLFLCSLTTLVVPVTLGRFILWHLTQNSNLHEIYTIFTGLYTIWLSIRCATVLYTLVKAENSEILHRIKFVFNLVSKSLIAISIIFVIIPFLFGLLFQFIVINPISCGFDQTPVISVWQVWTLGVLHTKILIAAILTGPQWWLKNIIERVVHDGFRNVDLKFIFTNVFDPIVSFLCLALAVPYILAKSVAPLFIENSETLIKIERRIYPISMCLVILVMFFIYQYEQFKKIFERIRDEKYLIGQRLINFDRSGLQTT